MEYLVNGKRMNATQLIALAKHEFRRDCKGMSKYAYPTTANKAEHYLVQKTSDNNGHDVKELWEK